MKFDLLLKNVNIVDVIDKKTFFGYLAVSGKYFTFVESKNPDKEIIESSKEVIDGREMFVIPGLIDTHMHIESSFVTPSLFARLTVPFGLSTILWDFHEIANVAGIEGIESIYKETYKLPLNIYLAIPSCVPATNTEIETPNFEFTRKEIAYLFSKKEAISLGEVMDYKGLLKGEKRLIDIIREAKKRDAIIDGHVPTLKEEELSLYISYGITSDHTLASPEKIEEELRKGLWVQIQEKSLTEKNISYLKKKKTLEKILFVTDDVPPDKIPEGHLLGIINKAINMGLSPFEVLSSSTIRAAERLKKFHLGSISPGKEANFFLSPSLKNISPRSVYFHGKLVAKEGKVLYTTKNDKDNLYKSYINIKNFSKEDLKFSIKDSKYIVNAICFNDINSLTKLEKIKVEFKKGYPILKKGVSLLAVISRNGKHKSIGFVKNLGPEEGGIATSYSHDSHPLTVLGKNPEDMVYAANKIIKEGGGIAIYKNKKLIFFISLPVFGLLESKEKNNIVERFKTLKSVLSDIGIRHRNPTQIITLLTLSVSPYYKMSDKGLVDTEKRELIPIIKEEIV